MFIQLWKFTFHIFPDINLKISKAKSMANLLSKHDSSSYVEFVFFWNSMVNLPNISDHLKDPVLHIRGNKASTPSRTPFKIFLALTGTMYRENFFLFADGDDGARSWKYCRRSSRRGDNFWKIKANTFFLPTHGPGQR